MKVNQYLCRLGTLIAFVVIVQTLFSSQAQATKYSINKLLPGIYAMLVGDINNAGQCVWAPEGNWGSRNGKVKIYDGKTIKTIYYDDYSAIYFAKINDMGKVIFWGDYEDGDTYKGVLFFYDGNSVIKIHSNISTDVNSYYRPQASINNRSQIAYPAYVDNYSQIFLYENGENKQLTYNNFNNYSPSINNKGQIVWQTDDDSIFLYDPNATVKIIKIATGECYEPIINDQGQIFFLRNSQLFLYDNGNLQIIVANAGESANRLRINNKGQAIWNDFSPLIERIYFYDGNTSKYLGAGRTYSINDYGQVAWIESLSSGGLYPIQKLYLYSNGVISQIYDKCFNDTTVDINNLGQIWFNEYLATPQVEVAKQMYGVCVGSSQGSFLGDAGAFLVAEKLAKLAKNDKNIKTFAGNFSTGGIKKSAIKDYLNGLSVNSDDLLIFYVTGHGGPTLDGKNYYVNIGPDSSSPESEGVLMDYDLYNCLQAKNCNKWVVIDACHSGGFWKELSKLNKLGLLTATSKGYFWFDPTGYDITLYLNYGWFTHGLLNALSFNIFGTVNADLSYPYKKLSFEELAYYVNGVWPSTQEFQSAIGTTMYEMAFGDSVTFTSDKYTPGSSKTSDLNGINIGGDISSAINLLLID